MLYDFIYLYNLRGCLKGTRRRNKGIEGPMDYGRGLPGPMV